MDQKPSERAQQPQRGEGGAADAELVRRTLEGQKAAFDLLVQRYQRQAAAVSYRLLGSMHDALEVTQDAFLKAYMNLATLQNPQAFGGWLMRIVSNLSLNWRRGRSVRRQLPLEELLAGGEETGAGIAAAGLEGQGPLRGIEGRELGEQIQAALAKLPEKDRLAIVMFAIEGMPQKEVAQILQCSVEAVKWHVFQGRKKLRELLRQYL